MLGLIALRMTFFEGATVFVAFKGVDNIMPNNLLVELIKAGFKTYITFDDGENIEFNRNTTVI